MTNRTKYYHRRCTTITTKWKEIPLNKDHMWFVQVDATIRTAFSHYGLKDPVAVYVDDYDTFSNIYVFRNSLDKENEYINYMNKYNLLKDELDIAAKANSDDPFPQYDWV